MKNLVDLDLPALRAQAKRAFLHAQGAKTPNSRREAEELHRQVLLRMREVAEAPVARTSA